MQQPELLASIHRWLQPGGVSLATWALHAWEGSAENWEGWGAPMWRSHHDRETNLGMMQAAGFRVADAKVRATGGERWLWVHAKKPGSAR